MGAPAKLGESLNVVKDRMAPHLRQERTSKTSIPSTSLPISKKKSCHQLLGKHPDRTSQKCRLEQVMKRFRFESFMRFIIQSPKYGTLTETKKTNQCDWNFQKATSKTDGTIKSSIPDMWNVVEFNLWNSKRCGWGSHEEGFFPTCPRGRAPGRSGRVLVNENLAADRRITQKTLNSVS